MSTSSLFARWFGSPIKAAKRPKFRPGLETLEERCCPAFTGMDGFELAGMGGSPATAIPLGRATTSKLLAYNQSLSISSATDVDYFKFTLDGTAGIGSMVQTNFTNKDGDLDLRLFLQNNDGSLTQTDFSVSKVNDFEIISLSGKGQGTYYFEVSGFNGAVNDYFVSFQATISSPFIPANSWPTLQPVGSNGQIANLRPQLSWDPSFGGDLYQVWLDDLTSGQKNLFPSAVTVATSWSPSADLVSGHSYRAWVRGEKFGGPAYPWSYSEDFTVSTVQFAPLSAPINDFYPFISWNGVQGASSYTVWLDNATTGKTNILPNAPATATGWQADVMNVNAALTPGNEYVIYVKAANAKGVGTWSPGQHFKVATFDFAKPQSAIADTEPVLPGVVFNHAGQVIVEVDDLTSKQTDLFPNLALNGNAFLPPSALTLGHSYRIWAKVFAPGNSVGFWGQPTDFSINTSISPIDPATSLRPTLNWSPVSGVANWEVWVTDTANANVNLTSGLIVNTNFWAPNFDLTSGASYQIWVRAQGGTWSDPVTFAIAKVNDMTLNKDQNGKRQISWTPLGAVTLYQLYVTDLTTGAANILPNLTINQPAIVNALSAHWVLPAGLNLNHTYRIWIKAANSQGMGVWSDPFDFLPNSI